MYLTEKRADDAETENTAAGCLHVCVSPLPDAKGKRKISLATVSKRAGGSFRDDPSAKSGPLFDRVGAPETVSSKKHKRRRASAPPAPECGSLGVLPVEMLEEVLSLCGARELGVMTCVSKFFKDTGIVERIAKRRVEAHPRAEGVSLDKYDGVKMSFAKTLRFAESADVALRTAAGVDLGAFHTAVLGVPGTSPGGPIEGRPPNRRRTYARDFARRRGVGDEDFLNEDEDVFVGNVGNDAGASRGASYAWGPLPLVTRENDASQVSRERVAAIQPRGRALYTFGRGFHGQL